MTLFDRLQVVASRRAHYRRTLAELRQMDVSTMDDLGLSRTDLPRIAHEAVYGR